MHLNTRIIWSFVSNFYLETDKIFEEKPHLHAFEIFSRLPLSDNLQPQFRNKVYLGFISIVDFLNLKFALKLEESFFVFNYENVVDYTY